MSCSRDHRQVLTQLNMMSVKKKKKSIMGGLLPQEIPGNNRFSHDNLFNLIFSPPNHHFYSTLSFHPGAGVCEITFGCVWKRLQSVQSQIAQGFPPPAARRHALPTAFKVERLAGQGAETFRLLKSCIVRRSGELYRSILCSVRKASSCYTGSSGGPHREAVH